MRERREDPVRVARSTLRLSVIPGPRRDPVDVEIDAPATATVGAVAAALADRLGVDAPGGLDVRRLGAISGVTTVAASGLRDGDIVALGRLGREVDVAATAVELRIVGGCRAGARIALPPGRTTIGRAEAADVTVQDPALSREHVALVVDPGGTVVVSDLGTSNGTAVDGRPLRPETPEVLERGAVVEAGRTVFAVVDAPLTVRVAASRVPAAGAAGAVPFNRPPRIRTTYAPGSVRLDSPPMRQRRQQIPWFLIAMPMVIGIAIYLITRSPIAIVMACLTPVLLLANAIADRRYDDSEHAQDVRAWEHDLVEQRERLVIDHAHERAARRRLAPDLAELEARATGLQAELWERRATDPDAMALRLGTADQPTEATIELPRTGDIELRQEARDSLEPLMTVPAVPVMVDLRTVGAVGVVGPEAARHAAARAMLVQAATLRSPLDLVIVAGISEALAEQETWLSWLPHVTAPSTLIDGDRIAIGRQATDELVRTVIAVLAERRADDRPRQAGRTGVLLVLDDVVAPDRSVVASLLEGCAEHEVHVLWLAGQRADLPGGCGAIVELHPDQPGRGSATWAASGVHIADMTVDQLELETADRIGRSLAPLRDVTAAGGGELPRRVSLLELLDLTDLQPEPIMDRWDDLTGAGLAAPLGAGPDGPWEIDLRDQGPHGLVAGTTGAGKSELLQTMIASLAAAHPPSRLSFLLIDYKGGAAFKDVGQLPHCVGLVTDLDEHEVRRALVSLEAELKRREHLLAAAGAKDLLELERRSADAPAPLVIVIDEFATLAKEVPAFVAGVVDVAQRGRSLGVHLVLATQRPSGAITANIRANTTLRMALRVASTEDSDDVVDVPDAARLPRSIPGRVLVRVGPGELTEVQTAYGGGWTPRPGEDDGSVRIRLRSDDIGASARPDVDQGPTDLQRLVATIEEATALAGEVAAPRPWLAPLPPAIARADLGGLGPEPDGVATLGLADEPRRQRQTVASVDLRAVGSFLVYGASGSGRSSTLRQIAASLAADTPVRRVHLHAIDAGGGGLRQLADLPHTSAVVVPEDVERVERVLQLLVETLEERQRAFVQEHANDLDTLRERRPDATLPRHVLLIDGWTAFAEAFQDVERGRLLDLVVRLVADGRGAGIHLVISGDRRASIPTPIAAAVPRRLVLRMAAEDDYALLGLAAGVGGPDLPAGRGFLDRDLEVQIARTAATTLATEEDAAFRAWAATVADRETERAPAIGRMPTVVDLAPLGPAHGRLTATLGVEGERLSTIGVSLETGHLLVAGPMRTGRSTTVATIAQGLIDDVAEAHLLLPRRSSLAGMPGWTSQVRGVADCAAALKALLTRVPEFRDPDGPVLLVVVDDAVELEDVLGADDDLEALLAAGRDGAVRVIAAIESAQLRHYSPWLKTLRRQGCAVHLEPSVDDGDVFGVAYPRSLQRAPRLPGRGVLVDGGQVVPVQVARPDIALRQDSA